MAVGDLDYQGLIVAALCLRYKILAQLAKAVRDENDAYLLIGKAAVDRVLDRLSVTSSPSIPARRIPTSVSALSLIK